MTREVNGNLVRLSLHGCRSSVRSGGRLDVTEDMLAKGYAKPDVSLLPGSLGARPAATASPGPSKIGPSGWRLPQALAGLCGS